MPEALKHARLADYYEEAVCVEDDLIQSLHASFPELDRAHVSSVADIPEDGWDEQADHYVAAWNTLLRTAPAQSASNADPRNQASSSADHVGGSVEASATPGDEASSAAAATSGVARWCEVRKSDGKTVARWDGSRIVDRLTAAEREDSLFLANVLQGSIPSGRIYPLLFDSDTPRSLAFQRLAVSDRSHLDALDDAGRRQLRLGVRDLHFAEARGLLSESERALLLEVVELLDATHHFGQMADQLDFASCPTSRCKMLRWGVRIHFAQLFGACRRRTPRGSIESEGVRRRHAPRY